MSLGYRREVNRMLIQTHITNDDLIDMYPKPPFWNPLNIPDMKNKPYYYREG